MSPLAREILGGGVPSRTCSILPTGKRRWARAARVFSGDTGTVRRLCVVHALRRLLGVLRACQGAVGCRGRKSERAGRKYFFAYAFLRSNVHRRWAMNRTASSQNCARESAPPMLVFAQRKKTRMQRFFLVFYGHLVSALQLEVIPPVVRFHFLFQTAVDTDTDGGGGLVAELFGYGLSQLQVKAAPRSSHSTVSYSLLPRLLLHDDVERVPVGLTILVHFGTLMSREMEQLVRASRSRKIHPVAMSVPVIVRCLPDETISKT